MSRFTDSLSELLHDRGMSQNELGRRLGVTSAAVSLWTQGKANPSRDHVERIEDELAVEPRGSLLEAAGYSVDDPGGPTVESLIRADPGLHPEDKRVFLRLIRMARDRFAADTAEGVVETFDGHP